MLLLQLSYNMFQEYPKVIVRRTDHSLKSIFDFFNVYHLNVWISMIVVFVLFTAFGLLVRYVECQLMLRERCNFAEILWKMVRFQLVQSEWIDYNLVAGLFIVLFSQLIIVFRQKLAFGVFSLPNLHHFGTIPRLHID